MKIGLAQTQPFKGDIEKNIEDHKKWIRLAVENKADLIVFSELSLTAYEPVLIHDLVTFREDEIAKTFQKISQENGISIAVGMPLRKETGIQIGMLIFQPDQDLQIHTKQYLHEDEFSYFIKGETQAYFKIKDKKIAPAICYESMLEEHTEAVSKKQTDIYLASVAKDASGVQRSKEHYPKIAKKYSMIIAMSNCVGDYSDFQSRGSSGIWNAEGVLVDQLDEVSAGILIYDTSTNLVLKK